VSGELVLVTGGTGFVGVHCIVQLLGAGYRVRTTLRSLHRASEVRAMVRAGGADPLLMEFAEADLEREVGWSSAVADATYVLHVASPFPLRQPKDAYDLITPTRDGALRVLWAARGEDVRRVVLTSSFAAIGYGHPDPGRPYTEEEWTDASAPKLTPYIKAKALTEQAAWNFMDQEGGDLELAVVNPVPIFGPALGRNLSTSVELLLALLNGEVSAVPKGTTTGVDVRDVADLHLRAMTHPDAAGERFLAISGDPMSFPDLAKLLRAHLGARARHVPKRVLPDWLVQMGAIVNPELRAVAPQLHRSQGASSEKARRMLGWQPRPLDEAIVASAESLVRLGLVRS
jgi:nucleoside-diphosphate-sugar epimerase